MRLRSLLAWLVVAPWAAWALVRLALPARDLLVVRILAFTPYAAAAAVLALMVAAVLRVRAAALVGAVSALLLVVAVAPRELGGGAEAEGRGRPLRVLTFNVGTPSARAADILRLVRTTHADVLSLQELKAADVRALERAGIRELLPGAVVRSGERASGTGLYARFPLTRVRPPDTTNLTSAGRGRLPGGAAIEILAVHPRAPIRASAVPEWRADLRAMPPPSRSPRGPLRILAGDFNATLDHRELRRLIDRGYQDAADSAGVGLRPTYPLDQRLPPVVQIDHVLVDDRAAIGAVTIHELPISDHRAVLSEVFVR